MKRNKCELIPGGWIGDDKPVNYTIIINKKNKKTYYEFKGIGEYEEQNEKELKRITEYINKLIKENQQYKNKEKIQEAIKWMNQDTM